MNTLGMAAEDAALAYLESQGLQLIVRNYTCRLGEIDLIMQASDETVIFVEVRQRLSARYGGAVASITLAKQRKWWRTASHFLQKHYQQEPPCRFDVIAFEGDERLWLKNVLLGK